MVQIDLKLNKKLIINKNAFPWRRL